MAFRVLLFCCALIFAAISSAAAEPAPLALTVHPGAVEVPIDDEAQAKAVLNKVPGNTHLVDEKQFANQRETTVKDIVDYIPGVFAQPRNGAESDRLSVRGSGLANTFQGRGLLVLQDSVPINMADGEFEFPVIDPWLTQFVEVFPGADALQFGASTFGGAINFITPTGLTDPGITLRGEVGSFGTVHGLASVGQNWATGDIFAAADGFHQKGFRQNNLQNTTRFSANLGWRPNDSASNRIYISHTHSDAEIPGALSKAQINDDPGQANFNNLNGHYQRDLDITRLADRSAWEEGPNRIDTTLFYTYRTLDNPVTTYEFQHSNDLGAQLKYTRTMGPDRLIAGLNDYYGVTDETRYINRNGHPFLHILDRDLYALTSEGFAQYEKQLAGPLTGIVGTQMSYATRNIHQETPTNDAQKRHYAGLSPRVGLRYDVNLDTQLFTNLSRSFEPPTFSELSGGNNPGFNSLKAQRATTFEFGARGVTRMLHWNAAYYHGWLRNELINYRFDDGTTATTNADRSTRDGIELGVNGDVAHDLWTANDAIDIKAAYSFNRFRLDRDHLDGNNRLPGVPEHYLRAETLYAHPSGISFGPNVEWVPQSYPVDLTNTLYTKPYALLGARTFWESADGRFNIYLEGRNLLDRKYIATTNVVPDAAGTDGNFLFPGEGRAVYTGFAAHF